MMSDELTCQELVELITDYIEGALSDVDRARFEEHLAGCTGCRNYLDQMRRTIHAVGQLTEADLIPAARDDLLDLFRSWKNR